MCAREREKLEIRPLIAATELNERTLTQKWKWKSIFVTSEKLYPHLDQWIFLLKWLQCYFTIRVPCKFVFFFFFHSSFFCPLRSPRVLIFLFLCPIALISFFFTPGSLVWPAFFSPLLLFFLSGVLYRETRADESQRQERKFAPSSRRASEACVSCN